MVMGHAGFPYTQFIYLFHMAIFFIASGYCWNRGNSSSIKSVSKYIVRKIKTLYVPYVLRNAFFLLCNNLFLMMNIYTSDAYFLELVGEGYSFSLQQHMFLVDIVKNLLKFFVFTGGTQLGGATWFLRALFLVTVGHCLLEFCLEKLHLNNKKFAMTLVGCAACVVFELYQKGILAFIPRTIAVCIGGYIAYWMGICIREVERTHEIAHSKWKYIFPIVFAILVAMNGVGSINMDKAEVTNIFFFLTVSILGWLLLYSIANIVADSKIGTILAKLGRNTLPIVCFHFLGMKLVTFLYVYLSDMPIVLTAYYPSMRSEKWLWPLYTTAGILVPLILNTIWKQINNTIKRIKVR